MNTGWPLSSFKDLNLDNLPDWQLGWLAGFIDGEGCIRIDHRGCPSVQVSQTLPIGEVITWMTGLGNFCVSHPHGNRKTLYRWYVQSVSGVYVLLSKLAPFLIIKKRQCDLMLKYCSDKLDCSKEGKRMDDKALRVYFLEMAELNKRGVDLDE